METTTKAVFGFALTEDDIEDIFIQDGVQLIPFRDVENALRSWLSDRPDRADVEVTRIEVSDGTDYVRRYLSGAEEIETFSYFIFHHRAQPSATLTWKTRALSLPTQFHGTDLKNVDSPLQELKTFFEVDRSLGWVIYIE